MFLATPPLLFAYDVVICEALKFASEIVKLPLDAPVNEPVPTRTLSALSSQPINTLSSLPLSMTIPESPDAEPELPVPNSMSWSSIVVLVALLVTVEPFTVRSPDTTTSSVSYTHLTLPTR